MKRRTKKKAFNLKNFIIGILRRASYKWPPRNEAKKLARIERGLYRCATCEGTFKQYEIQIDHIEPVVGLNGFTNWDDYFNRMFPDINGFQVLCLNCHGIKTNIENKMRKTLALKK